MPDTSDLKDLEYATPSSRFCPVGERQPVPRRVALGMASVAVMAGVLLGGIGCSTRSSSPTLAPDSTLVYASKITGDVQAFITFSLKGSKKRAEQLRLQRERQRQLDRERKAREARERADREKSKKTKKSTKKSKNASSTKKTTGSKKTASVDSLASAAVDTVRAERQAATTEPTTRALSVGERVFELEDGARVQASVQIENQYGRGTRPLMFHTVWLNPEGKRVFKKLVEWAPNDSDRVLTTSLTIPPDRRTTGTYTLQVFLFRELIAEKSMELTGISTAEQEKDDDTGM